MGSFQVAALYSVSAVTLVGIAIFNDSPRFQSSSQRSAKNVWINTRASSGQDRLENLIEFGVFEGKPLKSTRSPVQLESEISDADVFSYNVHTPDFPDWLPTFLQNGWAFVAGAVVLCFVLALLILGPEKITTKLDGWKAWFSRSDHIMRGMVYPHLPIHFMMGIFSVIGPIFILRVLELDVALLGALVMIEHATQVLTQYLCGSYVDTAGNKAGQQRSTLLLFVMSAMLVVIPFLPQPWVKENAWLVFGWYTLVRILFAWGTNQFDANYNSAINNAAFLPPADIVKTLDIFFGFAMLGSFFGAIIALTIAQYTDIEWGFLLPFLLTIIMYIVVETIPQSADKITFPPDPADISESARKEASHAGVEASLGTQTTPPAGKKHSALKRHANDRHVFAIKSVARPAPINEPESEELPWIYPIWFDDVPRWLLIQFIVILLVFTTLATSFTFMLPLAAMNFGLTDEDVGFLVAVPSIVGLNLFWLGSAFDSDPYVVKGCLAAVGFAAAYLIAYWSTLFTGLFLAAFTFAVTACYSCDLVLLLRICYLHKVTRFKSHMKTYFANAQEYASHLVAFNAPVIALVMDLASVRAAFLVWGLLSIFAVFWVGVVARSSIQDFLSKEELLDYMARKQVGRQAQAMLADGIFRVADRNGDGQLSREEFHKSYAAINELSRDEGLDDTLFRASSRTAI